MNLYHLQNGQVILGVAIQPADENGRPCKKVLGDKPKLLLLYSAVQNLVTWPYTAARGAGTVIPGRAAFAKPRIPGAAHTPVNNCLPQNYVPIAGFHLYKFDFLKMYS